MIINGGSRSNGGFFAKHLMQADDNERVTVTDMRGLMYAKDVPQAFEEMHDQAKGAHCKNWFYHANINTRADEVLTPDQWTQAVNTLEHRLGLDGQPRFIVEHEKEGRIHTHVVWSRVDAETMTTIHDGHNYRKHEDASREIEQAFSLEPVERCLTRDKEETPRQERREADWESFRAAETKIDPKAMKAELTEVWQHADSGPAFAAALEDRGYILARGDRRDFCIVDEAGDEHSLGRRLAGVKAADIRARMADIDPTTLPSVAEGRDLARQRQAEEPTGGGSAAMPVMEPFDAILAERLRDADTGPGQAQSDPEADKSPAQGPPTGEVSPFDAIMAERVREAKAGPGPIQAEDSDTRFARIKAWWSQFREYVTDMRDHYRDQWASYFNHHEEDEPTPSPSPPAPGPEPDL